MPPFFRHVNLDSNYNLTQLEPYNLFNSTYYVSQSDFQEIMTGLDPGMLTCWVKFSFIYIRIHLFNWIYFMFHTKNSKV